MAQEHYVDADFDSSGYGLIDLAPSSLKSESNVFLYVILQALQDIGLLTPAHGRPDRRKDKNSLCPDYQAALNWLLFDRKDFFFVCELAGADAMSLRKHVQRFLLGKLRAVRFA